MGFKRRFYVVEDDRERVPFEDFKFVNMYDIHPLGGGMPRTTRIPHPYGKYPFSCGLPLYSGKPKVRVGLKSNPPLDAYSQGDPKFISPRARHLFDQIDPEAFEYLECDTQDRNHRHLDSYWCTSIKRMVIEFDDVNSKYLTVAEDMILEDPTSNQNIRAMYELEIPDLPDDIHAFYISRMPGQMIFDNVLVDAWRAAGFTGLGFIALQEPDDDEYSEMGGLTSYNRLYWTKKRGDI